MTPYIVHIPPVSLSIIILDLLIILGQPGAGGGGGGGQVVCGPEEGRLGQVVPCSLAG